MMLHNCMLANMQKEENRHMQKYLNFILKWLNFIVVLKICSLQSFNFSYDARIVAEYWQQLRQ